MIQDWRILSKEAVGGQLESVARELEGRSRRRPTDLGASATKLRLFSF
jgi:hypothetical protein